MAPGAYEIRHRLAITAPQAVVEAARRPFVVLRETRDLVAGGVAHGSAEYEELEDRFDSALAELRRVMRRDLGVGG